MNRAGGTAGAVRDGSWRSGVRRHGVSRVIVRELRRLLAGGEVGAMDRECGVVVACSGGADSVALALAVGTANAPWEVTLLHVVHDMRPVKEAEGDAEVVRGLAARLGVACRVERVSAADAGEAGTEGVYRRLREGVFSRVVGEVGAAAVVTGHHADDQFETLLMALSRGAGPAGMRGVASRRGLAGGGEVMRPMLGVRRCEAEALCEAAGETWVEDVTNTDEAMARAAIRGRVVPVLDSLYPGAAARASRHAVLMRDVAGLVRDAAERLISRAEHGVDGALVFGREMLRVEPGVVVAECVRLALGGGDGGDGVGMDSVGGRDLDAVVAGVKGDGTEPRVYGVGSVGEVEVTAREVAVRRVSGGSA